MRANCNWCGKEYERIRATSLYCSDKCRLAFHRHLKRNAKNETVKVSVSPEKGITRDELRRGITSEGITARQIQVSSVVPEHCTGENEEMYGAPPNLHTIAAAKLIENGIKQLERVATLEHYHAHPELYTERAHPEQLNWGEPMTAAELADSSFKANRVTIPGGWDYEPSKELSKSDIDKVVAACRAGVKSA